MTGCQLGICVVLSFDVSCSGGVYPSGPFVLYEPSVKRVYTVTVGGFGSSNLRVFLSYEGIVGLCHYLVPSVVVRVGWRVGLCL